MKEVYIVRKICDFDGCRNIEKVFSNYKAAKNYVENSEYNYVYTFYDGSKEDNLIIERYEVVNVNH